MWPSFEIDKPLIIIGMHRSGTSFVAEMLHEAGIHMGTLRDPNFEAMHFLSLNQQLLQALQADWLQPKALTGKESIDFQPMELFCEHKKMMSRKFLLIKLLHNNSSWGWKDPRNTFTLPFWLALWPQARVLHVHRNGWEVAHSLKLRNNVQGEVHDPRLEDLKFNFNLWEKYVEQAFSYTNVLHVDYKKILQADANTLRDIKKYTGKDLSKLILNHKKTPKSKAESMHTLPDYVLNSKWMKKLYL